MVETLSAFALPAGMLALGLAVLLLSAERLVGASEEVGVYMGVPPFVMGLTILAVGTSLPELVTGIFAVFDGSEEIVVGTVVGSNVANILLILGFAAVYAKEMTIDWDLLHGDLPILFASLMLMTFFIYPISAQDMENFRTVTEQAANGVGKIGSRSVITIPEGALLVVGYGLYLYYYTRRRPGQAEEEAIETHKREPLSWKTSAWIVAGLIGVPIGAHFTVAAAVQMAELLSVGKEIVAASMISVGTSLPELVVSYSAVKRKNYEMALGNVTGSNIFNTFIVLGVPALIAPFVGNRTSLGAGDESILTIQMPFYIATVIVFLVIVLDKKLTRTEGLFIMLGYVVFISKLYSFI